MASGTITKYVSADGDMMTGDLTIRKNSSHILAQMTDVTIGTAPSANTGGYLDFSDSTGTQTVGRYSATYGSNGATYATMLTRNKVNGANIDNSILLRVSSTGARSVTLSEIAPWLTALGLGQLQVSNFQAPAQTTSGSTTTPGTVNVSIANSEIGFIFTNGSYAATRDFFWYYTTSGGTVYVGGMRETVGVDTIRITHTETTRNIKFSNATAGICYITKFKCCTQ